jgi:hypothetical protein
MAGRWRPFDRFGPGVGKMLPDGRNVPDLRHTRTLPRAEQPIKENPSQLERAGTYYVQPVGQLTGRFARAAR